MIISNIWWICVEWCCPVLTGLVSEAHRGFGMVPETLFNSSIFKTQLSVNVGTCLGVLARLISVISDVLSLSLSLCWCSFHWVFSSRFWLCCTCDFFDNAGGAYPCVEALYPCPPRTAIHLLVKVIILSCPRSFWTVGTFLLKTIAPCPRAIQII